MQTKESCSVPCRPPVDRLLVELHRSVEMCKSVNRFSPSQKPFLMARSQNIDVLFSKPKDNEKKRTHLREKDKLCCSVVVVAAFVVAVVGFSARARNHHRSACRWAAVCSSSRPISEFRNQSPWPTVAAQRCRPEPRKQTTNSVKLGKV